MKKIHIYLSIILGFFLLTQNVYAEYMLPYPSFMPGNKMYKITRLVDVAKQYWYWGNISQIKYHLGLADKYLVEAKVLFEYKQYLLATNALKRSDVQITKILPYVQKATKENKDMHMFQKTISEAMLVHESVISSLRILLPEEFVWKPEKSAETSLFISTMLDNSMLLRRNLYAQL